MVPAINARRLLPWRFECTSRLDLLLDQKGKNYTINRE
jgi:hypothetical protein